MTAEDLISSFIVNQLGIDLCSVKSISVDRQEDGQIKEIKIEFIPSTLNMQLEIKINGHVYHVTTEELSQKQLKQEKEPCVKKEFNVDELRSLLDKHSIKCTSGNASCAAAASNWSIGTFASDSFGMNPSSWNSF